MKHLFIYIALLLFTQVKSYAQQTNDPPGHESLCHCDTTDSKGYKISDYQSALEDSVKKSASGVANSIALDLLWAKKTILEFAPHLIPEKLSEAIDEVLLKFKKFLEKAAGPLVEAVVANAQLKFEAALSDKEPRIKYFGVYAFPMSKFSEGYWDGVDQALEGDSGATAAFKAEAEFNTGISFIAKAEFKIQLKVQGSCSLSMVGLVSATKFPEKSCITVSGFPHGRDNSSAGIEAQKGISAETTIGDEKRFTHLNREIHTICADEKAKFCP
jgi:hypothetical protein